MQEINLINNSHFDHEIKLNDLDEKNKIYNIHVSKSIEVNNLFKNKKIIKNNLIQEHFILNNRKIFEKNINYYSDSDIKSKKIHEINSKYIQKLKKNIYENKFNIKDFGKNVSKSDDELIQDKLLLKENKKLNLIKQFKIKENYIKKLEGNIIPNYENQIDNSEDNYKSVDNYSKISEIEKNQNNSCQEEIELLSVYKSKSKKLENKKKLNSIASKILINNNISLNANPELINKINEETEHLLMKYTENDSDNGNEHEENSDTYGEIDSFFINSDINLKKKIIENGKIPKIFSAFHSINELKNEKQKLEKSLIEHTYNDDQNNKNNLSIKFFGSTGQKIDISQKEIIDKNVNKLLLENIDSKYKKKEPDIMEENECNVTYTKTSEKNNKKQITDKSKNNFNESENSQKIEKIEENNSNEEKKTNNYSVPTNNSKKNKTNCKEINNTILKENQNLTANCFNPKIKKTATLQFTNCKDNRSISGRNPKINLLKQKIIISQAIPDYTKHFSSFNEILNSFFISSESKGYDPESALRTLYENFKNLNIFEKNELNSEKTNLINRNIVEAENLIIRNRIRKVSEFLLNDQNYLSEDRYHIFRKIDELQRKEIINDQLINQELNIDKTPDLSNTNLEFFRKNKMYFRVVLSRPEIYDIMCYTLGQKYEWRELPHGMLLGQSWNLLWTYSSPGINFGNLFTFQKVNHFINNRQLSRKDLLKKSIERVRKINQKLYINFDIMPKTYLLAREYMEFVDEFTRNKNNPNNLWIVKPVGKSRGRGIFLINELSEVPMLDSFLVQKYLTNPYLIDSYKFDMRIYVLVTSVNPLEAFLYNDGFARVSNMKFSIGNISNKLVHLTNAAIQNKLASKTQTYEKVFGGSKISLDLLKEKMGRAGVDFDKIIWPQVKTIILKSLVACQHDMPNCPSSFELFGYDIIIDSDLKCWLLEVNSSPSLDRTSVLDDTVKLQLVDDILNLVNPLNFDRNSLIEILERRLNINKSSSKTSNVYLYSPHIQLNLDLNKIFKGELPRSYGEIPKKIGNFEMIAPSNEANYLIKITGGEKKYNNKKM